MSIVLKWLCVGAAVMGPTVAMARCGTGETIMSCTAKKGAKAINVCLNDGEVSYAYGAPGKAPELTLAEHIATVNHTPWNGIGAMMWETAAFENNGYSYSVWMGVDRMSQEHPIEASVEVLKGNKTVATVSCDAGSVTAGFWALSDAKKALNLCWDLDQSVWVGCSN